MTLGASLKKSPNIPMYIEKNKIVAFSLLHLVMQAGYTVAIFFNLATKNVGTQYISPIFQCQCQKSVKKCQKVFP